MAPLLRLLASYRLTRLVVRDELTKDVRRALQARLPVKLAYLLGCPWCASMWCGLAVALAPRGRLGRAVIEALAASAVAGLVAYWLDPLTPEEADEAE